MLLASPFYVSLLVILLQRTSSVSGLNALYMHTRAFNFARIRTVPSAQKICYRTSTPVCLTISSQSSQNMSVYATLQHRVAKQLLHDFVEFKRSENRTLLQVLDVGRGASARFSHLNGEADALGVSLNITTIEPSVGIQRPVDETSKDTLCQSSNIQHCINEELSHLETKKCCSFQNFFDCVILNRSNMSTGKLIQTLEVVTSFIKLGGIVAMLEYNDDSDVLVSGEVVHDAHLSDAIKFLPFQMTTELTDIQQDELIKGTKQTLCYSSARRVPYRALREILRLRGPVASGYGRGGKQLGIPTANLPESLFADALVSVQPGVYFGWAMIEGSAEGDASTQKQGRNVSYKAVVNVGYSPTFVGKENKEKIIEAHLIVGEDDVKIKGDFYNETMRLSLIGALRPEKKFASFQDLLAAIHFDIDCAKEALLLPPFSDFRTESFLTYNGAKWTTWVGADGGNTIASWEVSQHPS